MCANNSIYDLRIYDVRFAGEEQNMENQQNLLCATYTQGEVPKKHVTLRRQAQ